ncbi:uncharacterized membrane protein YhaH (DUF805 family) [Novosphingobium kunmingense]|uniref:Uncharacterized membrane protein YhaH (DUF805 family) n=1 Tax=Novosphingobium kunmingense TaxID=1211806 RepID=A0A2N0I329_9SPHN|nr:DUF805 domain-containing protein [Novosphingobium kunmingense]PKB25571.1 uncharacterized membrane protein YhaH (DUF805 family) [Novosphingobium kunmingense]
MSDAAEPHRPWRAYVRGALAGTLRFSGRSRRGELVSYLVFQLLLGGLLTFIAGFWLDPLARDGFGRACAALLAIPMIALLVRRLHDVGLAGWWSAPIIALALYNAALSATAMVRGAEARLAVERILWPLDLIAIGIALGALALILAPGTRGPNRFGPDPRTDG